MLHSGLLSLSIHEALTFDGTEIVIHPDLFADATTISISSSRHSVLVRPPTITLPSSSSLASAPPSVLLSHQDRQSSEATTSPSLIEHKEEFGKLPTVTSESQLLPVAEASQASGPNRRLEVGNMVEIRVWNAKAVGATTNRQQLYPAQKQRQQLSSLSNQGVTQVASSDSLLTAGGDTYASALMSKKATGSSGSKTTGSTLEAAASALTDPILLKAPRTVASSTTSMQYSADSPSTATVRTPEMVVSPKSGRRTPHALESPTKSIGASTVSTEMHSKEVSLATSPRSLSSPKTGSLGILHDKAKPRSRSDTADHYIHPPLHPQNVHRPGKPPLVHRSNNKATMEARRVDSFRTSKSAHFRDISDMTMDTTMLTGTAFTGHEDLLAAHSTDTHDDPSHHLHQNSDDATLIKIADTHTMCLSIVMLVTEKTLTSLKGQARSQISMLRQVADLYELSPYDMVTVSRIEKRDEPTVLERVSADFVTVTIKDQFISRGDMHFFQKSLIGRWIYEGERISDTAQGIKAHSREIRHADNLAKSGIITEETKITFRSRSTRVVWLVQISSEMWDYSSPYEVDGDNKEESICELVFDKFVRFMYKLFKKWKELEVSHSLTVIFFSRTFLGNPNSNLGNQGDKEPNSDGITSQDIYGRLYEDHYKTVVDKETPSDWDSLVVRIKREFVKYPFEIGWDLSKEKYRRPSTAMQGNLLEAINVTLNLLQLHFFDRDLHRSGNSIVIVSPECGVFEVDRTLSGITYQRMMDNGIGSDMLCLGLPPLHVAPFFLYNNVFHSNESNQNDGEKTFSEVPHWMHLSFVSYDGESVDPPPNTVKSIGAAHASNTAAASVDELRIAPNGFLMPAVSPRVGKEAEIFNLKKFVGLTRNPVSPGVFKSQSQQRQLISGRDFKDILEACRPRTSSYMLPTPLANLLRLHAYANRPHEEGSKPSDIGKKWNAESTAASFDRLQLKEWGTVDFDDTEGPMSLSGSSILRQGAGGVRSSLTGNESGYESSTRSSPSSSIASPRSTTRGRSVERGIPSYSFLSGNQSPSSSLVMGGLKIQRSPSLEFESERNDGETKTELDADNFMTLMRQHDEKYSRAIVTPINRPNMQKPCTASPAPENAAMTDEEGSEHLGTSAGSANAVNEGLGAALKRYSSTGDHIHGPRDVNTLKRIYSSSNFANANVSPSQLGPVSQLNSRSVSTFMSSVGLKAGSEPPELPPGVTPQAMQAFMRSQQHLRLVQDPMGSLSNSFDQRRINLSRPASKHIPRQLSRSPPSFGRASPPGHGHSVITVKMTGSKMPPKKTSRSSRGRGSRHDTKSRKSVVNPFRQQDEDDELELKTHNRRRWSHVFSLGELEFKRHAGPLWKSLCQPAVLPLTIDYFPSPQELEDVGAYRFNPYQLTLHLLEHAHYASHRELLMEMVRQRVTQDFQVVPPSVLSASNAVQVSEGDIQHTLSMGHRIHVLTYDSQSDTIKVKLYTAITEDDKPITYQYFMYCPFTKSHRRVVQTFKKYSTFDRWNTMDHVILEDIDLTLSEAMRCRRLQFGIIPPKIVDDEAEQEYIDKFKRLLDYLGKLREKEEASKELDVKIITRGEERADVSKTILSVRRGTTEEMRKFKVRLRKGKRDIYEWLEVAFGSVFDTSHSYRIMFNWLVASSSKVEAQVQLLQRRCAQYKLNLISFPQTCISRELFLNPLFIPQIFCVRQSGKAQAIADLLEQEDFIYDGTHMTDPSYLQSIERPEEFQFPRKRKIRGTAKGEAPPDIRSVAGRQFVHRGTGGIFTRLIMDEQTWVIVVIILNHKLLHEKHSLGSSAVMDTLKKLGSSLDSITSSNGPVEID